MNNNYTLYSVPGPVSTLSSLMSTTWAVISWSVPSYIPVDYSNITYEIGYTTHQSNGGCSPSDEFSPMIKTNTNSRNMNISDLIGNTCYLFGVCGYTFNSYGLWTVIGNITLSEPFTICKLVKQVLYNTSFSSIFVSYTIHNHNVNISPQILPPTTLVSILNPQPTLDTTVKGM